MSLPSGASPWNSIWGGVEGQNITGEGATPFPGLLHFTLDPYLIMLSVKQGGIKYHFLSFWYDLTWDWTLVFQTIGQAWSWFSLMIMLSYILPIWHGRNSLTLAPSTIFSGSFTHWIPFENISTLFIQKNILFKEEETVFRDFLASKLWEFYHTGINNLLNRCQKCRDFMGSYYDRLNSFIQE